MWKLDLDEVGWPRHRRAAPEVPDWTADVEADVLPFEPLVERPAQEPWRPAIHLPLADPYQAPEGYWIKGNTHSGLYYTPDSELYENTLPEVWFASEDLAQANGFVRAPE